MRDAAERLPRAWAFRAALRVAWLDLMALPGAALALVPLLLHRPPARGVGDAPSGVPAAELEKPRCATSA